MPQRMSARTPATIGWGRAAEGLRPALGGRRAAPCRSPRARLRIALLSCVLLGAACALPAAGVGYLPAEKILPLKAPELEKVGAPQIYAGDELFDYINGGAPQFLEYGFIEVATQELLYREHTYIFDVYRFADPLAAFGVFSIRRSPRGGPLGEFAYSSATDYQALLAYGPYYIEIAAYESTSQTLGEMEFLARLGTAALDRTEAPRNLTETSLFRTLPAEARIAGSEKVARGPVSSRSAVATAPAELRRMNGVVLDALYPPSGDIRPERAPLWQVVAYHPAPDAPSPATAAESTSGRTGSSARQEPETILLRVAEVLDARPLLGAARAALAEAEEPWRVVREGESDWIAIGPEERVLFARLEDEHAIFFGCSTLELDDVAAWLLTWPEK